MGSYPRESASQQANTQTSKHCERKARSEATVQICDRFERAECESKFQGNLGTPVVRLNERNVTPISRGIWEQLHSELDGELGHEFRGIRGCHIHDQILGNLGVRVTTPPHLGLVVPTRPIMWVLRVS